MASNESVDKAKGRAKEALGDLTADRDLEREGKVDRAAGETKEKVGSMADRIKGFFRKR